MKIALLSSGSSGNSIYIEGNDTRILIDAGLSGKKISEKLDQIGADAKKLDALLVTHEHNDHIRGVGVISRRYDLPIYATPGTWQGMAEAIGKISEKKIFERDEEFEVGGILVRAFSTSHDANEPVGFSIKVNGSQIGIATDLGFVSRLVGKRLEGSNVLILESNHDIELLKKGSYPWYLKQRILSRKGHLSNFACKDALSKLIHCDLEAVALAHLSQENNRPEMAETEAVDILIRLQRTSTKVVVGNQDVPKIVIG